VSATPGRGADDRPLRQRKIRDRALVLPLLGALLWLPPFTGVLPLGTRIAGVPVVLAYVFVVWALLILGAALLARRLRDFSPAAPEAGGEGG
jgi:uncharacterized membrane protein YhaH (DUF805 family)